MKIANAPRSLISLIIVAAIVLAVHPVLADTVDVDIQNFAFAPQTVTVEVGSSVRWTNLDPTPHTSTSTTGLWDSGTLNSGQSFVFTFGAEGTFDYICTIHPFMTGSVTVTGMTDVDDNHSAGLPDKIEVSQNYPNPFNPVTTIRYALAQRSHVMVEIFNIAGQQVSTLQDADQPAGEYSVVWDGTDSLGVNVSSGIYLYRVTAGEFSETRKMVLVR